MAMPLSALLSYRRRLVDAEREEDAAVTSASRLVALHQPILSSEEGTLIKNLTQIARLANENECILISEDETVMPPADAGGYQAKLRHRYIFVATFNRLLTAPVLRLECKFPAVRALNGVGCFKVAFEFHFNDVHIPGIQGFSVHENVTWHDTRQDEIRFTSSGATCEGLNNIPALRKLLGPHTSSFFDILEPQLHALAKPQEPTQIRLRFTSDLDRVDAAMGSLLPYVLGEGVEQLPSITLPEYDTLLPLKAERDFLELMSAPAPYPMVQFECGDTYATIDQAAVELYESARMANLEQEVSLEMWAAVEHQAILYQVGRTVVMAVNFDKFRQLRGLDGSVKFTLPDRLQASATWRDPLSGKDFTATVNRCSLPVQLPRHDALFSIPRASDTMRGTCLPQSPDPPGASFIASVRFDPRTSNFTIYNQLNTVVNLRQEDARPWHRLILNQDHTHEKVDLGMKRAPEVEAPIKAEVEEAYQRILNLRKWNAEQLQALQNIRAAVGGIVLITGPAGTGKTLVLQAICVFLYHIGLHVLVLAPANSNCADFMEKLAHHFPDVPGTRVLPSSVDSTVHKVRDAQEASHAEFEMARADVLPSDKSSIPKHGLPVQVLEAARQGKHKGEVHALIAGQDGTDVWKALEKCILECDAGTFNWKNKHDVEVYQQSYNACKAHYVATSRLVVTTTGNVRTGDIINNFASGKHNIPVQGMVVILDEACKDREIDTLSALLWPDFTQKITGMVMLGDERQLEPTNTCSKGKVTFNPFLERLSIPFMTRLKREGFPCTELVEQHRMSSRISEWPSKNFYPAGMRDGPNTHRLLSEKQKGLYECMKKILASVGTKLPAHLTKQEEDKAVRARYLEVHGRRDNSARSALVREHAKVFFEHCYPYLRAYYGTKTNDEVMIICAYKEARRYWIDAAQHIQSKYKIPNIQLPKITTIDSSQGTEAEVVFLDCSVQEYSPLYKRRDIGFVDDDKRMNVAMTRAKEVRWILGGSCSVRSRSRGVPNTPAYVRHREEIKEVSSVRTTRVQADNETAWLEDIPEPRVHLDIRYADDCP